jgi:PIN domain nuclease of toxin-antitoxin system
MRLLLDTHLLLWTAAGSPRLSSKARGVIENSRNEVIFSVASLWEIAIKAARGRDDFEVDAEELRGALLANGFSEAPILGRHVLYTSRLPAIH